MITTNPARANLATRHTGNRDKCHQWYRASGIVLLASMALPLTVWYLAQHFEIGMAQAGRQLLRVALIKALEVSTTIYDPYSPHTAKLGPNDWRGWPSDALEPEPAIARLQTLRTQFGDSIQLSQATVRRVNDRAALFAWQPYNTKRLNDLRDHYRLSILLSGRTSQIAELAVLNDWVRRQWIHGIDGPVDFRQFYAGDIIEAGRRGARYWCQVASMTFAQVAAAVGYQARLISLSRNRQPPEHAVVEVWVDEIDKWVVFDTDFNLYYINKFGLPLNALELHRALANDGAKSITVVKGPYRPEVFDIEDVETQPQPLLLPDYRYFSIDMRNDWMTNGYFLGHPKRSDQSTLRWQDKGQTGFLDLKAATSNESELYWPLNHVEVRFGLSNNREAAVRLTTYLKTITPNFNRFEISVNDSAEFSHLSSRLTWHLMPGVNILTVRAVNMFGVKGPSTRLKISWR